MLRRTLERQGWSVAEAGNGNEGLERVRASRPALVLLDLMMPGIDGRQFRELQRADPRLAAVPTVIVTGSPLAQIVDAELTAADYLLKPVAREHLVSVVGRYCEPRA